MGNSDFIDVLKKRNSHIFLKNRQKCSLKKSIST